jgi:3-hydroxyisobutyrate dehydrogenase-like beta-hydroxyacid dehydrogenase
MQEAPRKIGWVGAGRMGTALATRLIEAGNGVAVWNRTPSKAAPLATLGASVSETLGGLHGNDVVFICVSSSNDLLAVLDPVEGLLASPGSISTIVDCSTVSPAASAQARELCQVAGIDFLAAPISGNPQVVSKGRATIAVSGPRKAYDHIQPLLRALTDRLVYTGADEQARLVKLCQNLYLGVLIEALVEVIALAQSGGIDRGDFLSYLNKTVVGSDWLVNRTQSILDRDWTPTFTLRLLLKDFDLGLEEARRLDVPMIAASQVSALIQHAMKDGMGDIDMLGALYERQHRKT